MRLDRQYIHRLSCCPYGLCSPLSDVRVDQNPPQCRHPLPRLVILAIRPMHLFAVIHGELCVGVSWQAGLPYQPRSGKRIYRDELLGPKRAESQFLRLLALCKGLQRVGASFLSPEDGNRYSFRKKNSVARVRERTIPTERPPLAGEVSANFCGSSVPRGQSDGSLRPYSRLSRPESLLFLSRSSSVVLMRPSGPRSSPTTSQKIW
jgi:hypothetical protein